MADSSSNVYEFKITLNDTEPEIWRRVQVPEEYNFYELHCAIQHSMGWGDLHMHVFEMKNPGVKKRTVIGKQERGTISEEKAKITKHFPRIGQEASYMYDMGDGWIHDVVLEKILPAEPGVKYPVCIEGERACPPDDCGGTSGYERLCEIMADPSHPEHEFTKEWQEDDFDPERFDPKEVDFKDPEMLKWLGW